MSLAIALGIEKPRFPNMVPSYTHKQFGDISNLNEKSICRLTDDQKKQVHELWRRHQKKMDKMSIYDMAIGLGLLTDEKGNTMTEKTWAEVTRQYARISKDYIKVARKMHSDGKSPNEVREYLRTRVTKQYCSVIIRRLFGIKRTTYRKNIIEMSSNGMTVDDIVQHLGCTRKRVLDVLNNVKKENEARKNGWCK